jgi:hypothetical protein
VKRGYRDLGGLNVARSYHGIVFIAAAGGYKERREKEN